MKIAVCVKSVPDEAEIDPATNRLDRSGEGVLNPFDEHAVEEALRLGEEGAEVVVVSLGPEPATQALRQALAMGAERAILVTDGAAAGSDLVATSRVLAKVLEREAAELVLCGQKASDSDGAVLGAAVAERLRWPVVSQAASLSLHDGALRAKRQTEFGYDEIDAQLPAVVAVSDAINVPRFTSLLRIRRAEEKSLETLSLGDVGVERDAAGEAGSRTQVLALAEPPARGDVLRIDADADEAAQAIVDFLAERRLP